MRVGESVKKGFRTVLSSKDLLGFLFAFGAAWNVLNVFLAPRLATADARTSAIAIGTGFLFILASIFVQSGSMGYVRDRLKTGSANLSGFFASGGKYYIRIFLLGLLVTVFAIVLILVAALLVAVLTAGSEIAAIVAAIAVAGVGLYFLLLMFFAPYYIVAGDEKVFAAIKKSISTTRKNLLPLLGIGLFMFFIGFVLGLILGVIYAAVSVVIPILIAQVIFAILSSVVNAILGVLVTASFMSFYLGLSANTNATN